MYFIPERSERKAVSLQSFPTAWGMDQANILATLSSTLALNLTQEHKGVEIIAEIIMNTLPVDSGEGDELLNFHHR